MDFLDTIIWDNPVKSYLIVFGIILVVWACKRYLSHWVASILFLFVKNNWKSIEKKEFVSLIIKPLSWFITVSISVFVIDKLNFPEAWDFKIYGHATQEILDRSGKALIIIYFTWVLTSLIDFIALILEQKAKLTKDKSDDQLIIFFRDFFKAIAAVIGILLIIKAVFNQNIGTVLTGLSIVGAALALAAKESLENLIASFIIFFDKPFHAGDTLKMNNVTGTVENIGLRSTRIRTTDKTLVTVPNKQMVDNVVDNFSMRSQRRAEIKLDFAASSPSESIEKLMKAIETGLDEHKDKIEKRTVFLSDFNKNGITITIEYYTIHFSMAEFNQLKQTINFFLKKTTEDLKLELASAGNDITIYNSDPGAAAKNNAII